MLLNFISSIVLTFPVTRAGLEADLEAALKLNSSQSTEMSDLKKAAATMTYSHESLTHELQSTTEQLGDAQTLLAQLATESQELKARGDAQVMRYTELESELNRSSNALAKLQGRLQAQTEATSDAQQELQGMALRRSDAVQSPF